MAWSARFAPPLDKNPDIETFIIDGPDETDAVCTEIYEAPLSILVRDGWRNPTTRSEGPEEYEVLLTTGGPGLRLTGKLDGHDQPDDWPRLEYQDWGTPWTEYLPAREHREALQKFASCFYYGEG